MKIIQLLLENFEQNDDIEIDVSFYQSFKIPDFYKDIIDNLLQSKSRVILQDTDDGSFAVVLKSMKVLCINEKCYINFLQFLESENNKI